MTTFCFSPNRFVEVAEAVPGAVVDLRYAGTDHPFGETFYPLNRAFVRWGTARKLRRAGALLTPLGLRLKVWDAYRPLAVQKAMWEHLPDERFVAPPWRGSRHNRGAAVDVTLVAGRGEEVPMPTGFDDFSEAAHASFTGGTRIARQNRDLLRRAMLAADFRGIDEEWWHFDDADWRRYPLCDLSLHELAARAKAEHCRSYTDSITGAWL